MNYDVWAICALKNAPRDGQYNGLSYEQASRRAEALCRIAAKTGQTVNASLHLKACVSVMAARSRCAS